MVLLCLDLEPEGDIPCVRGVVKPSIRTQIHVGHCQWHGASDLASPSVRLLSADRLGCPTLGRRRDEVEMEPRMAAMVRYHVVRAAQTEPSHHAKYNTYLTHLTRYLGPSIHMVIIYMLVRISRKRERDAKLQQSSSIRWRLWTWTAK
jgi:hypothetical protein